MTASSPESTNAFIAWALQSGAGWSTAPAQRLPLLGGYQLDLFGGLFRYGLAWATPQFGLGLTGRNASQSLTVYGIADGGACVGAAQADADQEFDHAAAFVLELLVAQEWTLPGWRDWVGAVWAQRGNPPMTDATRRRLEVEVVTVLQRETPYGLLCERVLAAMLDCAELAGLLAFLAPRRALEDADATLALLAQPEHALAALWQPVPATEREFLPWVVPHWAADVGLTYEQVLERLGMHGALRAGLARMHPRYLGALAEPLLGFAQPGLARAFWAVAGESVLQDCTRQAERPYVPVLNPQVSMAQIDRSWDAWIQDEPVRAFAHERCRPRAIL